MNKSTVLKRIIEKLTAELEGFHRAAHAARAEATHEQSKAENKYDTRGLEASYLARGQSRQAQEMESAIAAFEKLGDVSFAPGAGIDLGALIELEHKGIRTRYYMGPKAGGTEVECDGCEVMVITPQSPLGEQLLGRKQGARLHLLLAGTRDDYRVIAVE